MYKLDENGDIITTAERLSPMTSEVRMKYEQTRFLLMPDVHFDNPKCNRDQFHKMMKEAVKQDAKVCFFGDFFCLMSGRFDGRRSKSGIRPEYNKNNYLDLVINDAADQLEPYAHNILFMGDGNHETSVRRNCETDVLERLVERVNDRTGAKIVKMGYHGFIRIKFRIYNNGGTTTKVMGFHHGTWGGVVTRGTLGANRHGLVMPDADIIVTGHTHDHWSMEVPRFRLKLNGEVKVENQLHLKVGTMKEEFATDGGWAVEKLVMPKAIAGWWLDFIPYREGKTKQHKMELSYSPAN